MLLGSLLRSDVDEDVLLQNLRHEIHHGNRDGAIRGSFTQNYCTMYPMPVVLSRCYQRLIHQQIYTFVIIRFKTIDINHHLNPNPNLNPISFTSSPQGFHKQNLEPELSSKAMCGNSAPCQAGHFAYRIQTGMENKHRPQICLNDDYG